MNHNGHCGLFLDMLAGNPTSWVLPGVSTSPIRSLSKNHSPRSLWKGQGQGARARASAVGLHTSMLAGGIGNRAHIPQERGGAPGQVNCTWLGRI